MSSNGSLFSQSEVMPLPLGNSRYIQRKAPVQMLRLPQVQKVTGLGKTKIYELQAQGEFPMRVKLTSHSVGWIEEDIQNWLARRIAESPLLPTE